MYFSVYIFSPFVFNFLIEFSLGWKMSMESSVYLVFTDEASHHKQNLASIAWVVYSPEGKLVSSSGIFLRPSTNNVVKYSVVIDILRNSISHGISSLEVRLDSQFVLFHLNDSYHVRDPTLLRRFLCVQLLERHFDFITYHHIPRSSNYVSDAYTNYVLDWHLSDN
jgi:ribonuclease HI